KFAFVLCLQPTFGLPLQNFLSMIRSINVVENATFNPKFQTVSNMDTIREACNINYCGMNYYRVDADCDCDGCTNPERPENRVALTTLLEQVQQQKSAHLPPLFCFPEIIQHRLRSINAAFAQAWADFGYEGHYFLVYPIKVNQYRRIIESLITSGQPLGLEAGSKAELMAVLAHAGQTKTVIVCNGYKDREYIRFALMGEKLGHKVYLVIEKISEIFLVLDRKSTRLNS